ncbi:MAG: hypothetical protein NTX50_26845 [Candidatus Sumerlaeota bacterium]|nr:hypothetical protein [Candidatus Sumerlaeota bacterium]
MSAKIARCQHQIIAPPAQGPVVAEDKMGALFWSKIIAPPAQGLVVAKGSRILEYAQIQ